MIVEFRSCSRAASHVPRRATSDGNPSCFLRSRKRRARADKSLESSAPVELVKSTSYGKPTHEPPPKGAHSLQRKGRRGGGERTRASLYVRSTCVVEGNFEISKTDITLLPRSPIVDLCRSTIRSSRRVRRSYLDPEKFGHFENRTLRDVHLTSGPMHYKYATLRIFLSCTFIDLYSVLV